MAKKLLSEPHAQKFKIRDKICFTLKLEFVYFRRDIYNMLFSSPRG